MSTRLAPRRPLLGMSAVAAMSASLILSGCGSSGSGSAAASATNSSPASATSAGPSSASSAGSSAATATATATGGSSSANAADAPASISLSMQEADVQHNDPVTWSIVQTFMKMHPQIKVTVSGQPVAVHDQMIAVAAQSHTLPTIFWVNNADVDAKLAKAGALLDLAPMVKQLDLGSKIAPNVLSDFRVGDKQVGVPQSGLVTGF